MSCCTGPCTHPQGESECPVCRWLAVPITSARGYTGWRDRAPAPSMGPEMTDRQEACIADLLNQCEDIKADVYELNMEVLPRATAKFPSAVTVERASEIITELQEILHDARRGSDRL